MKKRKKHRTKQAIKYYIKTLLLLLLFISLIKVPIKEALTTFDLFKSMKQQTEIHESLIEEEMNLQHRRKLLTDPDYLKMYSKCSLYLLEEGDQLFIVNERE